VVITQEVAAVQVMLGDLLAVLVVVELDMTTLKQEIQVQPIQAVAAVVDMVLVNHQVQVVQEL
jgi:hypothetical protein